MEALVTQPYSVTLHLLHKLSSRQPEMLLENRLLLVYNIHEENQHGCLPLLNSIIQLRHYYEERSPLLFTSLSLLSELTVTSQRPMMDSLYKDLVVILHTYTHTQWYFYAS